VWKHRKDRNDHSDPDFDYEAWKRKHTAFADEAVPKWVDAVVTRYKGGNTKFVCVGYCFGAPYVCDELAKNIVTAGAFAHPAFLKEHHFKQITSTKISLHLLVLLTDMGVRAIVHVVFGS
jgi:dienelactone hydrolase